MAYEDPLKRKLRYGTDPYAGLPNTTQARRPRFLGQESSFGFGEDNPFAGNQPFSIGTGINAMPPPPMPATPGPVSAYSFAPTEATSLPAAPFGQEETQSSFQPRTAEQQAGQTRDYFMAMGGSRRALNKNLVAGGFRSAIDGRATSSPRNTGGSLASSEDIRRRWGWPETKQLPY